jgi:thiamine transport system ATP-binding protein
MRAQLRAAALGQLRSADLALEPGRYVVLANESGPLLSLVSLLAGHDPPRQGLVLLDGVAPTASPSARRKLATLFEQEALPPAKTLQASVGKALAARGEKAEGAARLLDDAGLSQLAKLALAALGPRELRAAALALALAHEGAELFALHEPLTTSLAASFVLARLDEHTARGALVLTTTTSPADATLLGGRWLCVELGRLRPSEGAGPRLGAGPWQQVFVETSDAPRLSQLLHASPHGLTTELGGSPSSLKITGPALEVTVQQVVELARQHGVELRRIEPAVPAVEALLAARAGFARGAYEASRNAALGAPPPSPAALPANPGAPS